MRLEQPHPRARHGALEHKRAARDERAQRGVSHRTADALVTVRRGSPAAQADPVVELGDRVELVVGVVRTQLEQLRSRTLPARALSHRRG
ncbi:MAG: hypothetical protein DYH12_30635 [Sorangiineae bacterium PRO1]|nr:hypothetical protein [Sorangiineae bacterium PRO1]